jgi:flagellar biosynthetic protein FlhB
MSGGEDTAAEKSHEPTPRRLEKARESGDLPHSQDAQTFAAYLGLAAAMLMAGGWAAAGLGETLVPFLDRPESLARHILSGAAPEAGLHLLARLAPPILALLALPALTIVALLLAQRGIVVAPQRIRPKLARISPLENVRSKYGPRGLVEFAKSAARLAAIGTAAAWVGAGELERLGGYAGLDARLAGHLLAREFRLLIGAVLAVAAALAAFDLVWQWSDHRRRLRMSHEELKEESKQTEGDPHLRAERRERGRRIANNRMLLAVPEADVVIANPTHYAVALKWQRDGAAAPVCVAKGIDEMALAIRARAEAAGVPVHSDPPAARSIHALVEVGQQIRPEHYQAVAAAIIFADEMRRRARARRL